MSAWRLLACVPVLLLAACATRPCAWIAAGERLCAAPLPAEPAFASRHERVLATTPRGPLVALGTSEWLPTRFTTVVTTPFGQRLYTLDYDGTRLRFEPGPLPVPVQAENVLIDTQLTWWPLALLRAGLPDGADLSEGEERDLRWRELRVDGKLRVRIRYSGAPDSPAVHLEQLGLGYSLELAPLAQQ